MKSLKANKEELLEAISVARSVVKNTNTIPTLQNIALKANDRILKVIGTDLDCQITANCTVDLDESFSTTVNANQLARLVQQYQKNSDVCIEIEEENTITISSGRNKTILPTLPMEEFPELPTPEWESEFTVPASVLTPLFQKCIPCVSLEETRYYLCGVYLHHNEETMITAASDGHKLQLSYSDYLPQGAENYKGQIIPLNTINSYLTASKKSDAEWSIRANDAKVEICNKTITILSKVVDGTFPDYNRIIPKDEELKIEVYPHQTSQMVRRVLSTSVQKTKLIALQVGEESLFAQSSKKELNKANDSVDAKIIKGKGELKIGLNGEYLTALLDIHPEGSTNYISFNLANDPIKITNDKNQDIGIIMPATL